MKMYLLTGVKAVPARFINQLGEHDHWSVKRIDKIDHEQRILVRINRRGLGVSFLEFYVEKEPGAGYRIYDWFNYGASFYTHVKTGAAQCTGKNISCQ